MILIIVEVRIMVISDFLNKANGFCAFNDVLENPCDKIIWNKEDRSLDNGSGSESLSSYFSSLPCRPCTRS